MLWGSIAGRERCSLIDRAPAVSEHATESRPALAIEHATDVGRSGKRFSLLRASQRALARCLHPAALEPLQAQARPRWQQPVARFGFLTLRALHLQGDESRHGTGLDEVGQLPRLVVDDTQNLVGALNVHDFFRAGVI